MSRHVMFFHSRSSETSRLIFPACTQRQGLQNLVPNCEITSVPCAIETHCSDIILFWNSASLTHFLLVMLNIYMFPLSTALGLLLVDLVGQDGLVDIATWLRAGRSGDRIPVGTRFSAPVQTGPGVHPASYTNGTGCLSGGKVDGAWR